MADKGIIFSAPMVRALLDGRKTQTRRLIKLNGRMPEYCGPRGCLDDPTCWGWEDCEYGDWITLEKDHGQRMGWRDLIGAPSSGDRLYVREGIEKANGEAVGFRADGSWYPNTPWRWKPNSLPGRYMPRDISRLWLNVTDVRVQRLQDISEADAIAEGLEWTVPGMWSVAPNMPIIGHDPRKVFSELWNTLHTKPGETWADNPWIVAVTFGVNHGNIDGTAA